MSTIRLLSGASIDAWRMAAAVCREIVEATTGDAARFVAAARGPSTHSRSALRVAVARSRAVRAGSRSRAPRRPTCCHVGGPPRRGTGTTTRCSSCPPTCCSHGCPTGGRAIAEWEAIAKDLTAFVHRPDPTRLERIGAD